MADGKGCVCHAYGQCECACGADWTPQEVYDLRAEVARLREALQSICQRYCYAYQNLAWTEMGSEYYSAYCIAAQAIQLTQPLPAPPDAG